MLTTRKTIVRDAIGIGLGVASYGVSFGALGVTSGLTVLQTQALSILMFTGASQFAFVGVIAAGGAGLSAIAAALMLGIRNFPYGLRMNVLVRPRGWQKVAAAQLTIDESTAMGLAHEKGPDGEAGGRYGFWATGVSVFVFWNLSTAIGAFAAASAGDPLTFGLDSAIAAGFVALLWPQLTNTLTRVTAVAMTALTIFVIPLVAPGFPILIAGCGAIAMGLAHSLRSAR